PRLATSPRAITAGARWSPRRPWVATLRTWSWRRNWRPRERGRRARSVADLLLQVLPALLLVDRALGGEPRLEPLQADLLARIHAVAVLALVDALERAVDLADQLAVAVAGAQLQRVLGLAGRALGFVADVADFVLEVLDRLLGFLDQVGTPLQQPLAEVLQHERIHVLLVGAGLVTLRDDRAAVLVGLVRHDLDLGLRRRRRRRGDAGHGDLAHRARTRRRGAGPGGRGLDRRLARGARGGLGDRARRLGRLRGRGLHRGLGRHLLRRRLLRGGLLRRDGLRRCDLLRLARLLRRRG